MPPIDAYEIGEGGTHLPVETGDGSTRGAGAQDAAAPTQTEPPAVTGASAPPHGSPPADSGLAAPDGGEDEGDIPETATVDYVAKRINRLNARYRAEQRAREADRQAAETRLAQQQGQIETLTRLLQGAAPDLPPQTPTGPPQAEQYADHDSYITAKARYEAQQLLQERDQQTQQQRQREQQQTFQQQLVDRVQAFAQAHPDYDAVIASGFRGKVAPHVDQAVTLLPDGPALAYALAQQPEVLQRLNTLPPPQVIWELARLLPQAPPATGESAPPATTPPANGTRPPPLPEPMRPVGGGGSPSPPGFREDASQEDYRAWRAKTSNLPRWKQG